MPLGVAHKGWQDAPMAWVIAHRGASDECAEHTPAAIERALALGADGVEVDVRLTLDNQVVLMHDATTRRVSDVTRRVSKSTLEQLQGLDVGAHRRKSFEHDSALSRDASHRRVMTLFELFEVLDAQPRDVGLLVETKHPAANGKALEPYVVRLFQHFGWNRRRDIEQPPLAVMSFSRAALQRVRERDAGIETTLLLRAPLTHAQAHDLPAFVDSVGPGVQLMRPRSRWLTTLREQHRPIYVWTVDTDADLTKCVDQGVAAVITNRPRWALERLHGTV